MKWRAFTLIELLVVIGIITVLIAIVVPSMALVREYARTTRCSSNIRQVNLLLAHYDSKNGYFPNSFVESSNIPVPSDRFPGNLIYDNMGLWWINYITDSSRNDLKASSVFLCPSRKVKGDIFRDNILIGNYGVNQSICKSRFAGKQQNEFSGSPLSSTDIQFPSQTLLVVDAGIAIINWHHVTESPPVPLVKNQIGDCSYIPGLSINKKRVLLPDQEKDALDGRHLYKTVNIGFVDGSVRKKKAEDLLVEKTAEGYKNQKPLWIPKKK
jgi:prepilin-type N-terminal cleavage/methylation domain-containing protein/prepilin-type processing-associated H-X9-DG protein